MDPLNIGTAQSSIASSKLLHTSLRSFKQGDPVWLSVTMAGKLDARWEGELIIQSVVNPTTYTIGNGNQ